MRTGQTNVVGVIQARTGSTRLPGKVLLPLAGRSVLGWVVRAARLSGVDDLVVATTTEAGDDAVVAECINLGVDVVRGPVDDVLTRFIGAVHGRSATAVARFTADCPLLDPHVVAAVIDAWRRNPWLDYASTALPRCLPRGMDAEVVRGATLAHLAETVTGYHRVHVTSAIYTQPDAYRMLGLALQPGASDLRVTLDTPEDFQLIRAVVDEFGDRPPVLHEMVTFLRQHPEIVTINHHIEQKAVEVG
jgi:spore coat polysaccharide biosynthesis protein SpsF